MEASVEEEQGATVEATEKKLTDKEIVAYSISFLLAGYETTSNTLAYISYLLALNPAVQKQLQTEIDEYFSDNPVTKHITQSHCEVIVLCTALGSGRSCIRIVFMFPLHSWQEESLYDATQKLQYLDMVIQEALRIYPPAPRYM